MATYAVLNNSNIVENIISADTLEVAETVTNCVCVEYNSLNPAFIGWLYDGVNFVSQVEEKTND